MGIVALARLFGILALGLGLAGGQVESAVAFGMGGSTGEGDSYLRQELQNPSYLDIRPPITNYSRPGPEQYLPPPGNTLRKYRLRRGWPGF